MGVDYSRLEDNSSRFEAGTPPIAESIGLGAAVDYLQNLGMENIEGYERELTKQMHEEFMKLPIEGLSIQDIYSLALLPE